MKAHETYSLTVLETIGYRIRGLTRKIAIRHIEAGDDAEEGTRLTESSLEDADIISEDVREKLVEAVGFRNVLAHRYGDVNHDIVYEVLHEDLQWFDQFQQQVARWLRERD